MKMSLRVTKHRVIKVSGGAVPPSLNIDTKWMGMPPESHTTRWVLKLVWRLCDKTACRRFRVRWRICVNTVTGPTTVWEFLDYMSNTEHLKIHSDTWSAISPVRMHCFKWCTGWTGRGSNPGGGEIFRTRPDWPWGLPSLLYNGYRVCPGGRVAGAWCWPPTPIFSAEVLNWVELYLYPS